MSLLRKLETWRNMEYQAYLFMLHLGLEAFTLLEISGCASIVKDSQQDFFEVLQQQPQEDMSLPELILPPLHQPIDEMNGRTLCSVLVGIAKDLWHRLERRTARVVAKKCAFQSHKGKC